LFHIYFYPSIFISINTIQTILFQTENHFNIDISEIQLSLLLHTEKNADNILAAKHHDRQIYL